MLVLALFLTAASTSTFAREFRAADTQNESYPTVQALHYMGSLVAERSGGRHAIKVFHSRQLGEEKETLEQTRAGAIDLNRTNVALIGTMVPAMNVLAMPFLFRSIEHLQKVLDGPIGNEILDSFEPYGFIGLAFYDSGARSIYNNVRPVTSMADLKGLRIRVQQSEQMVEMIRSLDADPVALPYGQVLTGLSTKLIDGAENNWPSYESSRHYEVAKNYSLTEHSMSPELLVFSKAVWDTLGKEEQDVIRAAAKESVPYMRQLWDEREAKSRAAVEAGGATIISDIDRQGFVDAAKPVYDKFAADPKLQDLIKQVQATE